MELTISTPNPWKDLDNLLQTDSNCNIELEKKFGVRIAEAVSALTKNIKLAKEHQMLDSLTRIKKLQPEVWAIKLADRITNLQPPPPFWDNKKKIKYQQEAKIILSELKEGNDFLARRLETKIEEYGNYLNVDLHRE